MKKFPIVLLCGVAAILATIILYFTILSNVLLEAIHFIALVAIVLAEAITTGYAYQAKGNPRKVGAAVLSAIMIPFSLVLSGIYILNFPTGYGAYLGWYVAATLVVNCLAFILVRFDSKKDAENHALQAAKTNMLNLRKLVKLVMADPAASAYADRLRKLEEKLHFSADNVIAAEDEEIRQLLIQLQENVADPEFDSVALLDKLEKVIDRRTILASRTV